MLNILCFVLICDWYISDTEAAWLPNGYAQAAACACTLKGLAGANSTSANCVRHRVQESHKNEAYFSAEQKDALLNVKNEYANALFYGFEYYKLLSSMGFAQIAQQIHVDAYAHCGCPGSPANLWAWKSVSLVGLPTQALCSLMIQEIKEHGPCGYENW